MEFPDSMLVRISHPREHGLLGAFVKVLSFLNFSQWGFHCAGGHRVCAGFQQRNDIVHSIHQVSRSPGLLCVP